jgi:hypothetical protein
MNTKILVVGLVVVAVVALVVFMFKPQPKPPVAVTADEEYILTEQLATLLDEQLAAESAEQVAFNAATEEDIASDISQFYYE